MTRCKVYSLLVVGVVFGAAACSSSSGSDAGVTVADSGNVFDGGTIQDAGMGDAGVVDAGTGDAGTGDAGIGDAGVGDAGMGDAGTGDAGMADAGVDGGTDAGCDDFTGFYIPDMTATCDQGVTVPAAACVSQMGCNVTVTTDQATYTGTAQGAMLNLTGTVMIGGNATQETCTGTKTGNMVNLQCQLTAGSITVMCNIPATQGTNPQNAASVCCDPTAATNSCMGTDRCTFTVPAGSAAAISACLPSQGMVMEGGDCTRSGGAGGADPGYDNCAAGLFCTRDTLAATASRVCRKICKNGGECTTGGQACIALFSVPTGGVCEPTCTYFGTDCAADTTCRPAQALDNSGNHTASQTCSTNGTVALGATCTKQTDCGAGAGCFSTGAGAGFACRQLCDMTNACTTGGETCHALSGQSDATLGFCAP